ncbi:MAG TPA: hypothetical protein VJ925_13130 [Longimicrobiales bacterium]|nr:hypothetical protein [Longimicrobiales bacterium]
MNTRRAIGILRWLLPGLALMLVPVATAGQSLEERRDEYRAALRDYEAAIANRELVANRFYVLLDSLSAARTTGDEGVIDDLEGRVRSASLSLQSDDAVVEEMAEALQEARVALLGVLDQRLDSLQFVAVTATDPVRRREAGIEIASLRAQYSAVEVEDLQDILNADRVSPFGITWEPRDTPATLQAKAELLQSKAQEIDVEIATVDQALERYRRAVELDRIASDARSTIDRFGDTQVPVRGGTTGARGEQGIVADTTGVDLESLPPQEAIFRLERHRVQLVFLRDQVLRRAQEFLDRIRGARGLGGER